MLLLSLLIAAPALADSDEAGVRRAIEDYVSGWREGDVERLKRAFALEHGYIIWRSGEGEEQSLGSRRLDKALEKRRPNPGYGEPYVIESIDIVDGYLAVAKFVVERAGKGSYVDYFTLYKVGGEWKIVTKAFTSRPGVLLSDR